MTSIVNVPAWDDVGSSVEFSLMVTPNISTNTNATKSHQKQNQKQSKDKTNHNNKNQENGDQQQHKNNNNQKQKKENEIKNDHRSNQEQKEETVNDDQQSRKQSSKKRNREQSQSTDQTQQEKKSVIVENNNNEDQQTQQKSKKQKKEKHVVAVTNEIEMETKPIESTNDQPNKKKDKHNKEKQQTQTNEEQPQQQSKKQKKEKSKFQQNENADQSNSDKPETPQKKDKKQKEKQTQQPQTQPSTPKKHEKDLTIELTPLQKEMEQQLKGSQFRWINEQLYTTSGINSFKLFQQDPSLFTSYHDGFQSQVSKWPVNPLDVIIASLKKELKSGMSVADFGCGEAQLAKDLTPLYPQCSFHSFDLVAANKFITACDIRNVPLKKESVDFGVFCLSLMGTNYNEFVMEAYRILKPKGKLKIAEVKSRFENREKEFKEMMNGLGFDLIWEDSSNRMFVLFDFVKSSRKPIKASKFDLKPCRYKKR